MCDEQPYNIKTMEDYTAYFKVPSNTRDIDYNKWLKCLWDDINTTNIDLSNIDTKITNWKEDHSNDVTATELNNYSMTLYQSDLKYTFSKIIFFIILAIVYIYFFKVNGIIEPIMKLFNYAKTKITVDMPLATEKVIKNIPKVPEIKTS
jgi:hypothetical protein